MADGKSPEGEPRPQSLPFSEMVVNLYKSRAGGKEPEAIFPFFTATSPDPKKMDFVCIRAGIHPPLFNRAGLIDYLVFNVNSASHWEFPPEDKDVNKRRLMRDFEVYDFNVDKLSDPTVIDDFKPINPNYVLAPVDVAGARELQSWIIDPHVRARINEYYQGIINQKRPERGGYGDVEKYIKLRNAAVNKYGSPSFGSYAYRDVRVEATAKERMTTNGMEPVTFRMFNEEDLLWLETYMKNKGLPIPQKSA